MSKSHVPYNPTNYEIETPGVSQQDVERAIRGLMDWMRHEQESFLKHELDELVLNIKTQDTPIRGSLNSLGRKLGIEPTNKTPNGSYNNAEMFRTSILTKVAGYLQSEFLLDVILGLAENPDPRDVIIAYRAQYPSHQSPTYQFVARTIDRLARLGTTHGRPTASGVLPLWATDTHHSKLSQQGRELRLTWSLTNLGRVTLLFKLPKGERFTRGKATRPTIYLDKRGKIRFGFTLQTQNPNPTTTQNTIGIDLGMVEPFVGTVLTPEGYSHPYSGNKRVNQLTSKIERLKQLGAGLFAKESLNKERSHSRKAEVLRVERLRVRSKVSRLKTERAHHVANQIVSIAQHYNAQIIMEQLNWSDSGKWERARTQASIENKAQQTGTTTKKINPKNTSQNCIKCGAQVRHVKRLAHCDDCRVVLDRDVLASRNIAARGSRVSFVSLNQLSLLTRVTRPVTPGYLTGHVKNQPIGFET